ncbi:MAG TPA: hypothetical protein VN476_04610 [Pyrinomonadaceae bacterium]|nr:hypothetical protein [Pyrinomonadaceae bacterium]
MESQHAHTISSVGYQTSHWQQSRTYLLLVMIYKLRNSILFLMVIAGLCAVAPNARAQSSDQSLPTPVLNNEINGKIKPLDLGDPRATRHFYAFEGSPGDLLITIDSKNLNGDIDVFTAVTFRPLMKTTVYASAQTPEVAKGIYLRTHQILILRVEARTPGDEPGTYHIRFGGTFERFSGGIPVAESSNSESEETTEKSGANRLSSVGATIPRPPSESVETAEAKPSPSPSPENIAEKPAIEPEAAKKTTASTSRRTTSRPPPRRGTRPASKPATSTKKTETARIEPPKTETETAKTETEKPSEEKPAVTEKPAETATSSAKTKTQEGLPAARLIIEEKDGTRIDRPMSTVRRVTIEGNAIVIILKTGKIERIAMADVARMSIEPQ